MIVDFCYKYTWQEDGSMEVNSIEVMNGVNVQSYATPFVSAVQVTPDVLIFCEKKKQEKKERRRRRREENILFEC